MQPSDSQRNKPTNGTVKMEPLLEEVHINLEWKQWRREIIDFDGNNVIDTNFGSRFRWRELFRCSFFLSDERTRGRCPFPELCTVLASFDFLSRTQSNIK